MSPEQVASLLAYISALDNREVTPEQVWAWSPLMAGVDAETALEAVQHHFATSEDYLMPAHVVAFCRERRQRQADAPPSAPRALPSPFEADPDRVHRLVTGSAIVQQTIDSVMAERHGSPTAPTDDMSPSERMHVLALARSRRDRQQTRDAEKAEKFVPSSPRPPETVRWDPNRQGAHCGRSGCQCTHNEGCNGGWIEIEGPGGYERAKPCPICKWHVHNILINVPDRGEAQRQVRQTGRDLAEQARRQGGPTTEQAW